MDPFKIYNAVKDQYKSYIETFQIFKNEDIKQFVQDGINNRKMLWQEPVIQISKRFKNGNSLDDMISEGWLHKNIKFIYKHFKPYAHQHKAFEIASHQKENLVVTTGTGSGKSMCFELPIVKRKDIDKFGTYRTKETILRLYDEFAWVKDELNQTSLSN